MSECAVLGIGMTSFTRQPEVTATELGAAAVVAALADAELEPSDVEALYAGHVYGGMVAGERVAAACGLAGLPVVNVENACASGTTAVSEAAHAIRAGRYDRVVVCGFEKTSDRPGMIAPDETDYESQLGLVFPAWYAMKARRYMARYGSDEEDLARVVVKNRNNGTLNPLAQFDSAVTVEDVATSRPVSSPLRLLDCCPKSDGAAALVLGSTDLMQAARRRHGRVPLLAGLGLSSGRPDGRYAEDREDITARAAEMALADAGIRPGEVDFAEVHDCFSIAEALRVEGIGLCEPGRYFHELAEGRWELVGRTPINPSGGLLAKGHPLGATGVAQVCEVTTQFRHAAGDRQLGKADVAIAHTRGGSVPGTEGGSCGVIVCVADEG